MKVGCKATAQGIELHIDDKKFSLDYPEEIWGSYPTEFKEIMVNNYAFLKTIHLPQFMESTKKIYYSTKNPMFKHAIFNCILNNISFCADVDNLSTAEEIKRFMNLDFDFKGISTQIAEYPGILDEKAILSMSFGKESLLSYGVADEIKLEPKPVQTSDVDCPIENKHKKSIAQKFSREFKTKVWELVNNTSIIHRSMFWGNRKSEWGYGHLLTELSLNLLPFAHYLKAKYLILGNEQSCNDFYINKDGYKAYPVYDQSSEWMIQLDRMIKALTSSQGCVVSLVEPLNELAIIKILHSRYPNLGRYQISCFPDDTEHGSDYYLCQHCPKCARIFIFLLANGFDPKSFGYNTNMLDMKFRKLYSIFGLDAGAKTGYDASGCGREEQLLAFYMAYKRGVKGQLIDVFKKKYLALAKEKEEDLMNAFFSVYRSKTLPAKIRTDVESIYKEELDV